MEKQEMSSDLPPAGLQKGRVPDVYVAATWRNTTPADPAQGAIGVGFDLPGGEVLRLRLDVDSAAQLADSLSNELAALKGPPAKLSDYTGDSYQRAGCTLVIKLDKEKWNMNVFAPGFSPGGKDGVIECFFARPHGSAGIAVDAFIAGKSDWRMRIPEMRRAEQIYSASGSKVTS